MLCQQRLYHSLLLVVVLRLFSPKKRNAIKKKWTLKEEMQSQINDLAFNYEEKKSFFFLVLTL